MSASKKVLIVHDDAALVERVRASLVTSGAPIEVVSAIGGPRALGMMATQHPDVIVVDAELVGIDGYALTQQLKKNPETARVPVVIVTLNPTESSALRARQCGAAAHLPATGPVDAIVAKVVSLAGAGDAVRSPQPIPVPVGVGAQTTTTAPTVTSRAAGVSSPASQVPPASPSRDELPPHPPVTRGNQRDLSFVPEVAIGSDPPHQEENPHIDDLLRIMIDRGGSDLHLTVGSPPGIRLRGEIVPLEDAQPLQPRDTMEMILSLLSEEQRRRFETELELDFAYSIPGVSRFRANVFQQRNSMGAVFRVIPIEIPTLEDLGLPKVCRFLADRPRGLVLVTGPTGSGKSTTLAAMIDHINETRPLHIVTLEDPIEFMHRNKRAYVNQREVGEDTHSFAAALKRVLRQDPDVILVGEMRDLETISAAITAAETGHLVLATLHTTGGPATVDRIIDVFPPHQQQQVRMQLSGTLEGVLSQVLLRSTDGKSRVMAMEIMLGVPAISNLIREGKTHQMPTIIQAGASVGMQTLDQHLKTLLQAGKVTFEEAISKAQSPRELAQMVGRKI
ncbi:MAG: PilT/PilU family type 4a pilus ATPase [Anaerosomatales bacterium]|nr:PilT/PilU family type 4a pilus ATPase [Anaerosomatales bacterium]MDT8433578.1 PilT/PilU family type 4a pilus ATPase [Anaerosomatales bacterium]